MEVNSVTIFLMGRWNPKIFTPAWIRDKLFCLPDNIEIQGLVNFDELDFAFRHNDITIFPRASSVEIKTNTNTKEQFTILSEITLRVLEVLPQTPIKAVGVNFKYEVKKTDSLSLVKYLNSLVPSYKNLTLSQVKLEMVLNGHKINIISEMAEESFNIIFNFHHSKISVLPPDFVNKYILKAQNILYDGDK